MAKETTTIYYTPKAADFIGIAKTSKFASMLSGPVVKQWLKKVDQIDMYKEGAYKMVGGLLYFDKLSCIQVPHDEPWFYAMACVKFESQNIVIALRIKLKTIMPNAQDLEQAFKWQNDTVVIEVLSVSNTYNAAYHAFRQAGAPIAQTKKVIKNSLDDSEEVNGAIETVDAVWDTLWSKEAVENPLVVNTNEKAEPPPSPPKAFAHRKIKRRHNHAKKQSPDLPATQEPVVEAPPTTTQPIQHEPANAKNWTVEDYHVKQQWEKDCQAEPGLYEAYIEAWNVMDNLLQTCSPENLEMAMLLKLFQTLPKAAQYAVYDRIQRLIIDKK